MYTFQIMEHVIIKSDTCNYEAWVYRITQFNIVHQISKYVHLTVRLYKENCYIFLLNKDKVGITLHT